MLPPSQNPFIVQETNRQRIFRYFMLIFLLIIAPVLIVVRLCLFIILTLLQSIVFTMIDFKSKYPKPLSPFRQLLYSGFSRLIGFLLVVTFGFIPIVRRKGVKRQHKDARIIAMNHTCLLDVPVSQYAVSACPVAKESLYNVQLLRSLLRCSRCVLVRRETEKLRVSGPTGSTAGKELAKRIAYSPVALMPEGTVPAPGYILRFRTGAFRTGAPVQPVTFQYISPIKLAWATHSALHAALMTLINPIGIVFITYHNVIYPKDGESPDEVASEVRNVIALQLKAKSVPYQNNDFIYFTTGKGTPTNEWMRDFGWMGTCQEFSKKYKINYKFGIYTWQVANIKPDEEFRYDQKSEGKILPIEEKYEEAKTVSNTEEILNIKRISDSSK